MCTTVQCSRGNIAALALACISFVFPALSHRRAASSRSVDAVVLFKSRGQKLKLFQDHIVYLHWHMIIIRRVCSEAAPRRHRMELPAFKHRNGDYLFRAERRHHALCGGGVQRSNDLT